MPLRRLLALVLVPASCLSQLTASPASSPKDDHADFVVRIDVNVVQVDAVVTDSKGHRVTDLKAEDFELLQDGVPQKITNISYVEEGAKSHPAQTGAAPPVPLKKEQVRRTIVLVVDDMGLSLPGMAYVRVALNKFVDHDMQPGDLVAIIRTGAGIGALQQFTSDKRLLHAAIDHVKFSFLARTVNFAPTDLARNVEAPAVGPGGSGSAPDTAGAFKRMSAHEDCTQDTISTLGSLAAVRYVIDGLRDLPGRKAMIFFSERLQLQERPDKVAAGADDCTYDQVQQATRRLVDAAERSAVVVYTIDTRGVTTLSPDAAANPFAGGPVKSSGIAQQIVNGQQQEMHNDYNSSQEGLQKIARETGGTFAMHNDIVGAIRDAVDDSSNYYVIAYHPPANTFDTKNSARDFHSIRVNVKRRGLRVRSRSGFFGFEGKEQPKNGLSPGQQFARVLSSPFATSDIPLRVTAFFSNWDKPLLTTYLYLDTKDLSFIKGSDGGYKAMLDVVGMTFDAYGAAVNSTQRVYSFGTTEKEYEAVKNYGLLLRLQHAVTRPGAYQMRVAVRDPGSEKMGSANQLVEVPDLKRGRLALSGILLKQVESEKDSTEISQNSTQALALDPKGNEAIRIFRPGEKVGWFYQIFNAKSVDRHANVNVQVRLFRDGAEVIRTEPALARLPQDAAAKYVLASGHMVLSSNLTPGDYALQLVVTDNLAKKKYSTASQWIDFAVENP